MSPSLHSMAELAYQIRVSHSHRFIWSFAYLRHLEISSEPAKSFGTGSIQADGRVKSTYFLAQPSYWSTVQTCVELIRNEKSLKVQEIIYQTYNMQEQRMSGSHANGLWY